MEVNLMSWINCAWAWITDHATVLSAVVSAVAAVVIARFTVVLAGATRGLKTSADEQIAEAKALREIAKTQATISGAQNDVLIQQKQIAQMQHLATHRPRLRVRHVYVDDSGILIGQPGFSFIHGARITGGLVVVNVGGTKARIVDSFYRIYFSKTGLPIKSPLDDRGHRLIGVAGEHKVMEIGESLSVGISDTIVMEPPPAPDMVVLRKFEREDWKVYVMGQIQYQDEGGHDRFMGFCRVGDQKSGFRPVDDPDYEYED
jgi:hypothetical protein